MDGNKWQWLHDKCIEKGYYKAAEKAAEIEKKLVEIYGHADTEAWKDLKEDWVDVMFEDNPNRIIGSRKFCIACVETRSGCCLDCKFGKETGICHDHSLFSEFCEYFEVKNESNIRS